MVIKVQDLNENDKLLLLFTEKLGKVSAVVKGAKKSKSRFLSSSQMFCYGEYVLYKGRNLYSVNEVQVIESFQEMLKDLEHITYASYFCELVNISMPEGETNENLFMHLISSFYFMKNDLPDISILARAFELKLLEDTGFRFDFDSCVYCGRKINSSGYISCQYGGGVCEDCQKANTIKISRASFNALRFLSKVNFQSIYRVVLSEEVKEELYNILSITISQNYFKKPRSLETLNYLKGVDTHE